MIEKNFINNQLGIKFKSYVDHKCRVWFKAKEVAQILGYCDTKKAVKQHVSVENKIIKLINPNVGGMKHPPYKIKLGVVKRHLNKKTLEENIA